MLATLFFLNLVLPSGHAQERSLEQRILGVGDKLEEKIEKAAEKLDITLAGRQYIWKRNPSRLDITQLATWSEGGRFRTSTDFALNLRLPNVEKRWQLRFTSFDEERESRDVQQRRVRTQARPREYSAGFLFFERLGKIKTSFLPRLQLKNPLDVNYLLRFESDADWKPVHFIPRVDLFADPRKGTGQFAQLEFRIDATDRLEIGLVNSEEYRDYENFFTTQHAISADYALNDKEAVGGAVTFVSINRPSFHLDTMTFSTVFAHVFYQERLRGAVTPFLLFAKSAHFKGSTGITFSLDLMF